MDRLMTESQKHQGGVSTLVRMKVYSEWNDGQVLIRKYKVRMDWGTACFAHLPMMLKKAVKTKDDEYASSDIVEILYLPAIAKQFRKDADGIRDSLDYLSDILKFMGVTEGAAQVLLEGWTFKLERSGQWNVAVCSLIRYLCEQPGRIAAYLYMRRTLKLTSLKSLYICHFMERVNDVWRMSVAPGGHTILVGRGCEFPDYPKLATWRQRDTGKSILESCTYSGINNLFGNAGYQDAPAHDPVNVRHYVRGMPLTDEAILEFAKQLKRPRGKEL